MTKLLSNKELGNLIDIAYKTATVGDSNGDKLTKDEFRGYMLATINTQKRLYAESENKPMTTQDSQRRIKMSKGYGEENPPTKNKTYGNGA